MSDAAIVITEDNVNPVLQILAWLYLATTTIVLIFRIVSRFFLKSKQSFTLDDGFISVSFISGVGVWITWFIPENGVFGQAMSGVSPQQLSAGIKVEYARELFYVASLAFSKLSVCANIKSLSPNRIHQFSVVALGSFVIIWLVSSLFATAFQCGTQGPWNLDETHMCINQRSFFVYLNITSVISDILLIIIPAWIIVPLQMPLKTRAIILSFYFLRILSVGATILEVVYIPLRYQDEYTRRAFPYYITHQLVAFFAISTACILYFWPLLRSLETGHIWGNSSSFQSKYPLESLKARFQSGQSSDLENSRGYINIQSKCGQDRAWRNQSPSRTSASETI